MPFSSPVRLSRVGAGPVLLALLALVASLLAAAGP